MPLTARETFIGGGAPGVPSTLTYGTGCSFIFEGDSITAGNVNPNPVSFYFAQGVYAQGAKRVVTTAVNGSGTNDVLSRYASLVKPHRPSANGGDGGPRSYLFVMIGTNDISGGSSASTIISAITSYTTQALSDGFIVCLGVISARMSSGVGIGSSTSPWSVASEITRQTVNNAILRGTIPSSFVYDIGTVCPDPSNYTFYRLDNLHLFPAFEQLWANYLDRSLQQGSFAISPWAGGFPKIKGPGFKAILANDFTVPDQTDQALICDTDNLGSPLVDWCWNDPSVYNPLNGNTPPGVTPCYDKTTGIFRPGVIGRYLITANVRRASATNTFLLHLVQNATDIKIIAVTNGSNYVGGSIVAHCNSTQDTFGVDVFHNAGSTDTIKGSGSSTTNISTWLSAEFLGGL